MKVSELIELLRLCPQDLEVLLAYDTFCCIYDLNERRMFILDDGDDYDRAGVYLCAEGEDHIEWKLGERVPSSPEWACKDILPGRRIRPLPPAGEDD
jgi:hypothetical protein